MELGLSLGDTSRPFGFMEKTHKASNQLGLGFNTTLSIGPVIAKQRDQHQEQHEAPKQKHKKHNSLSTTEEEQDHEASNEYKPLDLLPHTPAVEPINPSFHLSFPWHTPLENASRGLDVNGVAVTAEDEAEEEAALSSSPNSAASSFQMDLCIFSTMSGEGCDQRGCSRASDEDENGGGSSTRKKLRLSQEQSAFLEESFKEHSTLNPVSVSIRGGLFFYRWKNKSFIFNLTY